MNSTDILAACGLEPADLARGDLAVAPPIDGSEIARLEPVSPARMAAMIAAGAEAFRNWREVPAPRRSELVRLLGEELRQEKERRARERLRCPEGLHAPRQTSTVNYSRQLPLAQGIRFDI